LPMPWLFHLVRNLKKFETLEAHICRKYFEAP
jgi:hypothetical protein